MATAYTACDSILEAKVYKCILNLEALLKEHHNLFREEIGKQTEIADRLWVLSQRYLILKKGVPCIKPYPAGISNTMEKEILGDFHSNLNKIYKSNDGMKINLEAIVPHCQSFDELTKQIDVSVASPFIRGDCNQRPIFFYIELISDIFGHFKNILSRMSCCANLINICSAEGLDNYKKLLQPSIEFKEYLDVSLSFCKCLKMKLK